MDATSWAWRNAIYERDQAMTSRLTTLLGAHAVTAALKRGDITSGVGNTPPVSFAFADVKVVHSAFKRVVRAMEFDVAELAIVTFLMAKARGVPLSLLPVVLMSRSQHPYIVYDSARGVLTPRDLAGRRVGIRSHTVTTVMWVRGILTDDFGVDPATIRWVSFEDAHVAGFVDPPGVERAEQGKDLQAMLLAGEIDAAVIGGPITAPGIVPLVTDPDAAGRAWAARHDAIQINHMMTVRSSLCHEHPEVVREVYRLLEASKAASGPLAPSERDASPVGVAAMRRSLDIAVDHTFRQGLIPRRFSVDELFADLPSGIA